MWNLRRRRNEDELLSLIDRIAVAAETQAASVAAQTVAFQESQAAITASARANERRQELEIKMLERRLLTVVEPESPRGSGVYDDGDQITAVD